MAKRPSLALVPPTAKAPRPTAKETADLSAHAVQTFVDALGGRERFTTILSTGSDDAAIEEILNLLLDPTYAQHSVSQLCARVGLTVADLFRAFATATELRHKAQAAAQLDSELPKIIADLLQRAQPYEAECPVCLGEKQIQPRPTKKQPDPAPMPCRPCHATGRVQVLPDLERQKLVLELADLLKKGSGPTMQQNVVVGGGHAAGVSASGLLERMQQVVSDTLYGRDAPIEATSVEVTADAAPTRAPDADPD